jgi:Protein of unknown function (DUF2975)
MGKLTVLALRIVLAVVLAGSVFVQAVMVPLLTIDMDHAGGGVADRRFQVAAIVIVGIATIQVVVVCVWKLLTMVRRGTVFSEAAFRYVHIIIAAAAAACLLTLGLAATLAPGEEVPPGFVLLIGGVAVMVAGIALIVLVLRMLLAQAVALDAEATQLQAELEDVI